MKTILEKKTNPSKPEASTGRGSLDRLVRLSRRFDGACRDLCNAAKEELPVGTILDATLGRARIRGEVVSHEEGWSSYYAGTVNVRNLKSGKIRRVMPHYNGHEVTVISLPNDQEEQSRSGMRSATR